MWQKCPVGLLSSVLYWSGGWGLLDTYFLPSQVNLIILGTFLTTTKISMYLLETNYCMWLKKNYFNVPQLLASLVISAVVGIVGMIVTGTSRSFNIWIWNVKLQDGKTSKYHKYLQVLAWRPLQRWEGGRGLPSPTVLLPCPYSLAIRPSGRGVCLKLWFP